MAASLSRVTCRIGGQDVLRDLSMTIDPGEVRALVGPNGAGKTTVLRTLAGLVSPVSGAVRVGGASADLRRQEFRRMVCLVPSGDRGAYMRLSGIETMRFYARQAGMPARSAREEAARVLDEVGLTEVSSRRVGTYSRGMLRRLLLARALMGNPLLILLDEATHDLDPDSASRVRSLVRDLAGEGRIVAWATQRLEEVEDLADSVSVLAEGASVFDGSVAELAAQARRPTYILRLTETRRDRGDPLVLARARLKADADLRPRGGDRFQLTLRASTTLGVALDAILRSGFDLLSCRAQASDVEMGMRALTSSSGPA